MSGTDATEPHPIPQPRRRPLPDPAPDTPDELPEPERIDLADIGAALSAGWRDFRRAPAFGLLFSAFYVLGGLVLAGVAFASGREWWLIPFVLGFPLIAPFAAIGLYEVSRRIEAEQPLDWPQVMGVVFSQKDRQIPSMSMVILLLFMVWVIVAHTVFAVFMGASALNDLSQSALTLFEGRGLLMLLVGSVIGAGFAGALFAFTVVGLPVLLEREVDFITAIIVSVQAVFANPVTMLAWGAIIVVVLALGILPLFLGLFVALPVLGHASWHVYRRLMPDMPPAA